VTDKGRANLTLTLNTVAFTVCFAAWMLNGVLVTFLVDNQVFDWSASQMGWLIGIPVLTGSIVRLPLGMLTDKFGGRPIYTMLMLASAVPMYLLSRADSYTDFLWGSLGFGGWNSFHLGVVRARTSRYGSGNFRRGQRRCSGHHDGRSDTVGIAHEWGSQCRRMADAPNHLFCGARWDGGDLLSGHEKP